MTIEETKEGIVMKQPLMLQSNCIIRSWKGLLSILY